MVEATRFLDQESENKFAVMEDYQHLYPDENHQPQMEEPTCDEECEELQMFLYKIDEMVTWYGLIPLCIIGIVINVASIGALFNNTLHLRRSLIQLLIFLNSSDV